MLQFCQKRIICSGSAGGTKLKENQKRQQMNTNEIASAVSVLKSRASGCASLRSAVASLLRNGSTEKELLELDYRTGATRDAVALAIRTPAEQIQRTKTCYVHGCRFVASDASTNVQMARHINRMHIWNDTIQSREMLRQVYGISMCKLCFQAHAGTVLQHKKACERFRIASNCCAECFGTHNVSADSLGTLYCRPCWRKWKVAQKKRSRS